VTPFDTRALEKRIDALAATPSGASLSEDARDAVENLLDALEQGSVRSADKDPATGEWRAVPWVKRGILLGFRLGAMVDMSPQSNNAGFGVHFFDKDTYPPRALTLDDGVRVVPGGSSIRRGAYLARGVVCMPPMYVNVGAHVGAGTMIDSHALVGSCAQVGERVHLSAAAQLGGVLEPVNAAPVVVEDDVVVGGNCGIYEGTVVKKGAVIGAGVVLTRGTPVYDLVRETVHRADAGRALVIPENAVVVPGARQVKGDWGQSQGIALQTPVIVKYRDEKTDAATALESWLR
jgi:2,3,4,5-tetrahydropyridine-2,6-dicarboxylate N-succinyltransferase